MSKYEKYEIRYDKIWDIDFFVEFNFDTLKVNTHFWVAFY